MPAYAKQLRPAEVTALVAFLETLRPENQPPARDSAVPATGSGASAASGTTPITSRWQRGGNPPRAGE